MRALYAVNWEFDGMEYPEGFLKEVHSRKPICGVLAVAVAAQVSFDVAHATCKQVMLDKQLAKRFGGRTWYHQREEAMRRLGVKFSNVDFQAPITAGNWVEYFSCSGVLYVIDISGHTFTVKDGLCMDQSRHLAIRGSTLDRAQVKRILRIDGKGW